MRLQKPISNPEASTSLIIIMGVSGSGKSTLAQALAKHYGYAYLDGDNFHSREARDLMAQNIPLTDAQRIPWVAALKQHLENSAASNTNISLAFSGLRQKHRDELRKAGLRTIFLFLHGDKDIIQARINNRQGHFMSPQLLTSQFASLENPTTEDDVYTIDISADPEQVLAQSIAVVDKLLLQK